MAQRLRNGGESTQHAGPPSLGQQVPGNKVQIWQILSGDTNQQWELTAAPSLARLAKAG
jgi:hypothetical protein